MKLKMFFGIFISRWNSRAADCRKLEIISSGRVNDFVYITDASSIPMESYRYLIEPAYDGLTLLI